MTERKKLPEPRRPWVGRFVVSVTEELPAPRRFGVETMKAWIAEDEATRLESDKASMVADR